MVRRLNSTNLRPVRIGIGDLGGRGPDASVDGVLVKFRRDEANLEAAMCQIDSSVDTEDGFTNTGTCCQGEQTASL